MEVLHYQSLVVIRELRNFGPRRVGNSSLVYPRIKKRNEFGAEVHSLSAEIGGQCVRGSWRGRYGASQKRCSFRERVEVRAIRAQGSEQSKEELKVCVRCGMTNRDEDNSPVACKYHGHMTGDPGLYALAPPHQGIDGEWTDGSGVIVYKWNDENERPSTGSRNWKRRWTCCGVYAEDAVPCHSGRHVTYDDGATRF